MEHDLTARVSQPQRRSVVIAPLEAPMASAG
jgi:hypothetical protein